MRHYNQPDPTGLGGYRYRSRNRAGTRPAPVPDGCTTYVIRCITIAYTPLPSSYDKYLRMAHALTSGHHRAYTVQYCIALTAVAARQVRLYKHSTHREARLLHGIGKERMASARYGRSIMSPQAADTDAGAHRGPVILFTTQAPVQARMTLSVLRRDADRETVQHALVHTPGPWPVIRYSQSCALCTCVCILGSSLLCARTRKYALMAMQQRDAV